MRATCAQTDRAEPARLGPQNQQRDDDATGHRRGENGAQEHPSKSSCHGRDGRSDPSSGDQPQCRPSAAAPDHEQVFQPTVDRRAGPAGHHATIRVGFLIVEACKPAPTTRASRDWLGTSATPMPPIPTYAPESSRALAHRTSWARPRRRRAYARSVRAMRKRARAVGGSVVVRSERLAGARPDDRCSS